MIFTVRIELGNDAMQTPDDVGHELYRLSKKMIGTEPFDGSETGNIYDINGNKVGTWEATNDD